MWTCDFISLKVWSNWRRTTKYQLSLRQIEEEKVVNFHKQIQHSKKNVLFTSTSQKSLDPQYTVFPSLCNLQAAIEYNI